MEGFRSQEMQEVAGTVSARDLSDQVDAFKDLNRREGDFVNGNYEDSRMNHSSLDKDDPNRFHVDGTSQDPISLESAESAIDFMKREDSPILFQKESSASDDLLSSNPIEPSKQLTSDVPASGEDLLGGFEKDFPPRDPLSHTGEHFDVQDPFDKDPIKPTEMAHSEEPFAIIDPPEQPYSRDFQKETSFQNEDLPKQDLGKVASEFESGGTIPFEKDGSPSEEKYSRDSPVDMLRRDFTPVSQGTETSAFKVEASLIEREVTPPLLPERERSPSPTQQREKSPSPILGREKTPSPVLGREKTPSPALERERSPSPIMERKRSPSPILERKRSPSPILGRENTPSPVPQKPRTPSPVQLKERTPSPVLPSEPKHFDSQPLELSQPTFTPPVFTREDASPLKESIQQVVPDSSSLGGKEMSESPYEPQLTPEPDIMLSTPQGGTPEPETPSQMTPEPSLKEQEDYSSVSSLPKHTESFEVEEILQKPSAPVEEPSRSSYKDSHSEEKESATFSTPEPDSTTSTIFRITALTVLDLIYWRDTQKSGIVYGSGMAFLLLLRWMSLISVVSYMSLFALTATMSFRIYKNVMQAIQKTQDGHPFKEYLELDVTIPEDKVKQTTEVALTKLNCMVSELRRLFLVEDFVDSLKFGVMLWCFTYIGAWFNSSTLIILAYVGLFTLPKVYEINQTQIDQYIDLVRTQFEEIQAKVRGLIPLGGGSKEKAQ